MYFEHMSSVCGDEVSLMLLHHAFDECVHLLYGLVEEAVEVRDLLHLRHVAVVVRVEDLVQIQVSLRLLQGIRYDLRTGGWKGLGG